MGTVTYPEPAVAETINQRFVPLQLNVTEAASRPLIERYRQAWTPDIRVLGPDGFEFYRWNGFLPPFEFLPQLLVGEGQAYLRQQDDARAAVVFDEVARRFPTSHAAPEALYYLAAATYRGSHRGEDLLGGWAYLRARYPDSIWRVKQLMVEEPPVGPAARRRAA